MNDNLPKKYNNNIFSKIIVFVKNIFKSKKKDLKEIEIEIEKNKIDTGFIERMKVNETYINVEEEKRRLMSKFNENPKLLENLSINRLEMVLKYYQEDNEKKKETIKKLTT